ncbi:hypothetical protein C8R47DRAFT_232548 [Mycena vitilis]|nr:hypothetical protein C8R47DRAFT_232548 [Mycena vitilis]
MLFSYAGCTERFILDPTVNYYYLPLYYDLATSYSTVLLTPLFAFARFYLSYSHYSLSTLSSLGRRYRFASAIHALAFFFFSCVNTTITRLRFDTGSRLADTSDMLNC